MKKISLPALFMLLITSLSAQNLQVHFDPRNALYNDIGNTNYITSTFEMFKPDKWGSTFMFVDFDYNLERGNIGLAYWEIARDIKMGKCPIQAHIEYNGGIGNGFSIPNAYLFGGSYGRAFGKLFINTYLAYKYNAFDKVSNDIQWTVSWNVPITRNNKLSFNGFCDIWTENKFRNTSEEGKKVILLAEPQIWFNANKYFSVGTEIEISNRFYPYYPDRMHVLPTIAAKWTFN